MSRIRPPENIEIAALRRKQQTLFDPMTPGGGTPWEDRATHGTLGAFFKTCFMGFTSPAKLMSQIRRPETTTDAKGFLAGISGVWAISAILHFAYFVWKDNKPEIGYSKELNTTPAAVLALLTVAAAGGGCFFLFKLYNTIYGKLVANEKGTPLLPEPLLYNVNVYALGPTLLAIIPFVGPPIALLWIFANLVVAGNKRLRLRLPAAIIDGLISLSVCLGIAGAVYFIGEYGILNHLVDYHAIDIIKIPTPK